MFKVICFSSYYYHPRWKVKAHVNNSKSFLDTLCVAASTAEFKESNWARNKSNQQAVRF